MSVWRAWGIPGVLLRDKMSSVPRFPLWSTVFCLGFPRWRRCGICAARPIPIPMSH